MTEVRKTAPDDETLRDERDRLADEVRRLAADFHALNAELAETNKGVVALYAELDDKAEQLRHASELKSRFLSYMSHEFRTPLGSIRSIARLLLDRMDGPLTAEQEKYWAAFNSAMHYLGHNGAERLNLRVARAKRDPPDDIIEQMRNEAQFLNDRAVDQRNVADAAEPLFSSLDAKQKQFFIQEMVNLSHERGLD